MPFEKQFYSGGANSMRGWQARTLGPGRAPTDTSFVIPSQTGDVKLEVNLEYRFPLFWKLYGALFTDIGNVWTLKATDEAKDSQFRLDDFQNSMASDIGFGIRMDLNFLILRLDLGMKTYDPSKGENAYYDVSEWLSKDSYAIHFGVGYPF